MELPGHPLLLYHPPHPVLAPGGEEEEEKEGRGSRRTRRTGRGGGGHLARVDWSRCSKEKGSGCVDFLAAAGRDTGTPRCGAGRARAMGSSTTWGEGRRHS